ncbi:MAG: lytic transglycosylase domain-containing protein [Desulfobulbaceae bacterium]|nr:MAG: lytic transglycosylase domain-containing protein [Desulfobulbaceae bacterium]
MKRPDRLQLCLLFSLLLVFAPTTGWGDLGNYLSKYNRQSISRKELIFLSRYDHLIRYFTSFSYFLPRHKVSPDFVRALILAESGGNSDAVSSKNARGLGQLILPTARKAGQELARSRTVFRHVSRQRLADLKAEDLHDPAVNILLTCYLVAKYNYRFDGRLDLVVSAWNAGEHTSSLAYGRYADYEETKDLIGKVNSYYRYLLSRR